MKRSAPARCEGEGRRWHCCHGGWEDSAWFEHTFLADEMQIALVQSSDLSVRNGRLLRHIGSDVRPVDVVYAADGRGHAAVFHRLRRRTASARPAGKRSETGCWQSPTRWGNGIGDDKAIYAPRTRDDRVLPGEKPSWGAGADVDLCRTHAA